MPCVWLWTVGVLETRSTLWHILAGELGREKWRKGLKSQGSKTTTIQMSVVGTEHLKTHELQENEKET